MFSFDAELRADWRRMGKERVLRRVAENVDKAIPNQITGTEKFKIFNRSKMMIQIYRYKSKEYSKPTHEQMSLNI
jgi:hypothetical protein